MNTRPPLTNLSDADVMSAWQESLEAAGIQKAWMHHAREWAEYDRERERRGLPLPGSTGTGFVIVEQAPSPWARAGENDD